MFGFGNKDRVLKDGTIQKEMSYMMAVPMSDESIRDIHLILDRLKKNNFFTIKNIKVEKELVLKVIYKDKSYEVYIKPENYELSGMYKINHNLSEENYNLLMKKNTGIKIGMIFSDELLDSYHLQLKILYTVVPNLIGVIDFSGEKILSPMWTRLCAESNIPPSPEYIYSIQAMVDDNKKYVWLHTHGLNRCGSIELEVLKSDYKNYTNHSYILKGIAERIISENKFIKEEEPFWLGRINNGDELVITWINFEEASEKYDKKLIGSLKDREKNHNKNTGVIYVYLNKNNCNKRKYSHISSINKYISDNLLIMLTDEETNRMSDLAKERIEYFINEIEKEDVKGIMKIALEVDEEYKNDDNTFKEHVWFEITSIDKINIKGKLTQDPYYIKNLKAGTEIRVQIQKLTDWILYTSRGTITPDSVYRLEENFC